MEPPARARLAWSRAVIDRNYSAAPAPAGNIPTVRSMAALRARAGAPGDMESLNPLEPLRVSIAAGAQRQVARGTFPPAPGSASALSLGHRLKDWIRSVFK